MFSCHSRATLTPSVRRSASSILCLSVALALLPAQSFAAESSDDIAALRAELERLQQRLAVLEAKQEQGVPPAPAPIAPPAPAVTQVSAGPGLKATSADGESSFKIGGRIHMDAYVFDGDTNATGGTEFRRARFQFDGTAAGWGYRLQSELSGRTIDLRDVYLQREFGAQTLTIGQFKPYRSMDELTSSNDVSVLERGTASGSGFFNGRVWQQGLGVMREMPAGTLGVAAFWLREDNSERNEGWGTSARGTWTPIAESDRLLHLGAWVSVENGGRGTAATSVSVGYAGRRGPELRLFTSSGNAAFEQRAGGVEAAGTIGSFHWQSEWSRATVAGLTGDGELEAAYLQAGWLFGGAVRKYKAGDGVFGSPNAIGDGLWEIVARVDDARRRDISNLGARRYVVGVNRYMTDGLRLMLNWTSGEDRFMDQDASQLGLRVQYVF